MPRARRAAPSSRRSLPRKNTRDQVQWQYCVGDGGCLCSGICEVPQCREAMVRDNYPCMPEITDYVFPDHPIPAFTTRRRDPRLPPPPELAKGRLKDDSCEFAPQLDARGCRHSRKSKACLSTEVISLDNGLHVLHLTCKDWQGCVLTHARCDEAANFEHDLAEYDYRVSDRWDTTSGIFMMIYPALDTSVCDNKEPACLDCVTGMSYYGSLLESFRWTVMPTEKVRCLSPSDCVCPQLLEMFDSRILRRPGDSPTPPAHSQREWIAASVVPVAIALIAGTVWLYNSWRTISVQPSHHRGQAVQITRNMLDQVPEGMQLDSFGWRRFHQQLRDKEEQGRRAIASQSPHGH